MANAVAEEGEARPFAPMFNRLTAIQDRESVQEESRMGEGTDYFTPEFFAFFRGLSKNNRKVWFDANKAQFQAVVLEPSVRFVRDAGDRLKKISPHIVGDARAFGGSISRIYRDIRFSPDKSPYKTHIGIHFWHDKAGSPEHMTPGYFSPPGVRGERRPFRRLASGAADPQENPGSNRRRARCLEDRPSIEDRTRGRVPETASTRLRSEPSPHPGPPSKGLHRSASLPRHGGHEPGFPGEFREGMRVNGPSKPIPRAVDGTPVVTST